MRKKTILVATVLAVLSWGAWAHGQAKPLYGGQIQVVADIQYELLAQPRGAWLYVVDHGQPVDVSRMSGKLTVLNGTERLEADLKPAGGNKLEAQQVKLGPGAKVVATLKGADGRTVTVRFALK